MKDKKQLAKEYRKSTVNQMYIEEIGFIAGYDAAMKVVEEHLMKIVKSLADGK